MGSNAHRLFYYPEQSLSIGANHSNRHVKRGAIAVLVDDDKCLVVRRADRIAKGGYWCFPGGHVEAGETSRRAIAREMVEELGIVVEPTKRLGSLRVEDTGHVLVAWMVSHVSGEFRPAVEEIAEYRWLTASAIRQLPLGLASNEQVLQMLTW